MSYYDNYELPCGCRWGCKGHGPSRAGIRREVEAEEFEKRSAAAKRGWATRRRRARAGGAG